MKKLIPLVVLFAIGLIWSGIAPHDYFTWFLEVVPAIMGAIVMAFTYKRFQLSTITYWMILIHCWILFIGGHYTYAEVPFFDVVRDIFHQSRNNYDKLGHFTQGFVPAFIARELLIRHGVIVDKKGWLGFVTVSICMAISALYELIEWAVAVMTGESADSFLGTQGYLWDTQSDMLMAAIGACCMVLFVPVGTTIKSPK